MNDSLARVWYTLLAGFALLLPPGALSVSETGPIKVGVLHSLTGTMAISERPLVDAARMAIVWTSEEPIKPEPYPELLFPAGPPARVNENKGGGT
jgi:hypothetical protein